MSQRLFRSFHSNVSRKHVNMLSLLITQMLLMHWMEEVEITTLQCSFKEVHANLIFNTPIIVPEYNLVIKCIQMVDCTLVDLIWEHRNKPRTSLLFQPVMCGGGIITLMKINCCFAYETAHERPEKITQKPTACVYTHTRNRGGLKTRLKTGLWVKGRLGELTTRGQLKAYTPRVHEFSVRANKCLDTLVFLSSILPVYIPNLNLYTMSFDFMSL